MGGCSNEKHVNLRKCEEQSQPLISRQRLCLTFLNSPLSVTITTHVQITQSPWRPPSKNRQFRHEPGLSTAGVVRSFSPNHRRPEYPAATRDFAARNRLPSGIGNHDSDSKKKTMELTILTQLKRSTPSWRVRPRRQRRRDGGPVDRAKPVHGPPNGTGSSRLRQSTTFGTMDRFRTPAGTTGPLRFAAGQKAGPLHDGPAHQRPGVPGDAGLRREPPEGTEPDKQTIGFNWGAAGIATSVWKGVPLVSILKRCGVYGRKKGALNVCFEGRRISPGAGVRNMGRV
ncbi:LOW QUALITY PROTEIN: hypothetical protein OSB04_012138 [Centaurea solstitialis]|uniref:Oxidoreductase molybdopterin-binding domain-containing protein n=1 Tax=Centaurea solstitialis TaxID=347529 RepID=A0AA38WPR9_9ASTR|nr:LOW QUALITY PROTEIN: hypothetical protein OSB04_012138 [Centaurea solstitialis]